MMKGFMKKIKCRFTNLYVNFNLTGNATQIVTNRNPDINLQRTAATSVN